MSKSEAKKDYLLCRGLEVMKANGYNGTSVKDIVDAAEVPKGSFYNYFDSKKAFVIEAIEHVANEGYRDMSEGLRKSNVPPLDRLQQYFLSSIDGVCSGNYKVGCFLGNMCQEMSDSCEDVRAKIVTVLSEKVALIEEVLKEAQAEGRIPKESDPAVIAEFILNAWQGALMRMKASKSREPLDAFVRMLPVVCRQ